MNGYLTGLLAVVLLAAVAVACVWLTDTDTVPAADDLPEQQRAMAAEWTAFINSLPVTTEDFR